MYIVHVHVYVHVFTKENILPFLCKYMYMSIHVLHIHVHTCTCTCTYMITVKTVRSINTCGHLLYNPTGG